MSLWKFGDFETDVDFTDADFLDAIEEAKAVMSEAQNNIPVVGRSSDIVRAQCACYYAFFDTLFGEGAGDRIFCGRNSIKLCNEAAESLLAIEAAESKELESKYAKYTPNTGNVQPQYLHPQYGGNHQNRRSNKKSNKKRYYN